MEARPLSKSAGGRASHPAGDGCQLLGAAPLAEIVLVVAFRRSARRAQQQQPEGMAQGDGLQWPMLRHQQALQARLGQAEQAAAAMRAQVLISQGCGPLMPWLQHPGSHPGERPAASGAEPEAITVLDLFDAA